MICNLNVRSVVGNEAEAGFKRERLKDISFTAVEFAHKLYPTTSTQFYDILLRVT